jgi:hypothetical protein
MFHRKVSNIKQLWDTDGVINKVQRLAERRTLQANGSGNGEYRKVKI